MWITPAVFWKVQYTGVAIKLTLFVYVPAEVDGGAASLTFIFVRTRADVVLKMPENGAGESPMLSAERGAQFWPTFQLGLDVLQDAEVAELTQLIPSPGVAAANAPVVVGVHVPLAQVVSLMTCPPSVWSGWSSREEMV